MFLNPYFKMTTCFANITRTTGSTSELTYWDKYHKNLSKKMDRNKLFIKMWIFYEENDIRFKTSMLRSELCDYSYVYNVVKDLKLSRSESKTSKYRIKQIKFCNTK